VIRITRTKRWAFGTAALALLLPRSELRAQSPNRPLSLPDRLAWQIALENVALSPGIIDGRIGAKTQFATREFQRVRGLPITGRIDVATAAALRVDSATAVMEYRVGPEDLAHIAPLPTEWLAKSKLKHLGYESLESSLAEKFHCTRRLLAELNPGKNVNRLAVGDRVSVPNVDQAPQPPVVSAEMVEIDLSAKVVRVLSGRNEVLALFHCSIAADKSKRPSRDGHVDVVANDPTYLFDPKMWPEVRGIDRKLVIAPGPRNPVGICWVGLSLPGYGIHGTPSPELIGKTGSHGCFRLTNWDAKRLGKMVQVGTRVRFVEGAN